MRNAAVMANLVFAVMAGAFGAAAGFTQPMPSQEQMMKMGACMANLDPSVMETMHQQGELFRADIQRLCKAGNRSAALQRAMQFGKEMANDPALKQLKACTAGLPMPQPHYEVPKDKLTTKDICSL